MNLISYFLSKQIIENHPDGILIVSDDGQIKDVNPKVEEFFELGKKQIQSKNFFEMLDGGCELIERIVRDKISVISKIKITDTKELQFAISASLNKSTEEPDIIVDLRDVTKDYIHQTDLIMEIESSKQVNRNKNAFLTKIGNDLKSPLHSIVGFSQALLEKLAGDLNDKQEKYTRIINKNANELLSLQHKIIELSQIESGLFEPEYKSFDLADTLNNVLLFFNSAIQSKNRTLKIDSTELIKKICYSDENLVRIIFGNLLESTIVNTDSEEINIKITHPTFSTLNRQYDGVPDLISEKSFVLVKFLVEKLDIMPEELPYIFDPYVQADKHNKKYLQTSLSLAVVRYLARHLGGCVWIEMNMNEEQGFMLLIPIDKQEIKNG